MSELEGELADDGTKLIATAERIVGKLLNTPQGVGLLAVVVAMLLRLQRSPIMGLNPKYTSLGNGNLSAAQQAIAAAQQKVPQYVQTGTNYGFDITVCSINLNQVGSDISGVIGQSLGLPSWLTSLIGNPNNPPGAQLIATALGAAASSAAANGLPTITIRASDLLFTMGLLAFAGPAASTIISTVASKIP